ncbi:MAG: hypothetical protein PWP64_1021 [Candidatus Cloacimonadota bacterium]|nr:hypothetical protein [Candidatus Cloacimonadota bacterium]
MRKCIFCLLIFALGMGFLVAQDGEDSVVSTLPETAIKDSLKIDLAEKTVYDSLFYAADSIRAYYEDEQIWLFGNPEIDYYSSKIQADSIFLDLKKEQATTFGLTLMQDNGQLLIGEDVKYDVRSQTGLLRDAQSYIENGYYSGEEIRKIGSDVYDIDGGSFTTCDLAQPSYWFWAKAMRIYNRDKVVGKHVVAYVNHLPIFYFPFVSLSIKRGRHPGLLIPEPGYNNVDGKYVRDLAIYYPYKDYADFTLGFDLMEKTGWKAKFNSKYIKRYYYQGGLSANYQKNINSAGTQNDWSLKANHHHDLPEKSALDVSLDFISNKRMWEGSNLVDESLAQRLYSSISYRKPLGTTYLNAGALYNQDLINDTASLSLPSVTWSVSSRPLYELLGQQSDVWYSGLSYYYNFRLDHTGNILDPDPSWEDYIWANTYDPDDPEAYLVEHHFGAKHSIGLSNSYNYRGWLNLRQSLSYADSWFDRDRNQKKWVRGNDYSASLNGSFNLYGLRSFQEAKINTVRHIMTPSVSLSYTPDQSRNSKYYSFGGISLRQNEKQANLSFALAQKWQVKLGTLGRERKINDLFSWDSRISANLYKEGKRFGDISHTLAFKPGTFNLGDINSESWQLKGIKMSYSNRLSMVQDTYRIGADGLAIKNQYFSQTIGFSGSAPYAEYFPKPKNKTFSGFNLESEDALPSISNENWSLSLTHDLFAPKSLLNSRTQNLRMNAGLKLTKNFTLSYSNYYNLKDQELISQSFSLSRDLHCWKLDFSFTKRNEYWDYRIVFFNLQFPDALKLQTRDSKRY